MESKNTNTPVAIVMGSKSDWTTMEQACLALDELGVAYHTEVVSAHRTPEKLLEFSKTAQDRGFKVIIAGAGGAAHLPGMIAASTTLPVLGVPVQSKALNGLDSLLSIVQMPKGVAVGTLAIGQSGAFNAGMMAAQILGCTNQSISKKLEQWRRNQTDSILNNPDPSKD